MDKVIVTIQDEKKRFGSYDLELPVDVPIKQLKKDIIMVIASYKKSSNITFANDQMLCARLKRILEDEETLESAGVWNGDYIIFR